MPNWLVAASIAASLAWHWAVNGLSGLWGSGVGLAAGISILLPLYWLRGLGAGDVKFFGAVGAGVTLRHVGTILVLAAITLFAVATVEVVRRGRVKQTISNIVRLLAGVVRAEWRPHSAVRIDKPDALLLPFTAAVAIAVCVFLLFGGGRG